MLAVAAFLVSCTAPPEAATCVEDREPVIGIDLGTTYSAVAVWDVAAGGVRILADEAGNRTVPSYVGWSEDGERLIGHRAKDRDPGALERAAHKARETMASPTSPHSQSLRRLRRTPGGTLDQPQTHPESTTYPSRVDPKSTPNRTQFDPNRPRT